MDVALVRDPAEFLREAEPFLLADEARHNLMLGIAGNIRSGSIYEDFRLWLVRDRGEVVAAAVRTPPYNLILAQPRSPQALAALADAVAGERLPGVVGAQPEATEFAELWTRHTASSTRTSMRQGVYAVDRVAALPAAPGSARVATAADRELARRWWIAFAEEAHHEGGPGRDRAGEMIDFRLASPTAGILLWEDDGMPVSLAGWGGPTPNGIRVGPVYTPPELRGRGYATALTAELSRCLLDGRLFVDGRRFCFLYTDLANPTSNAIYERIGYRRVAESAEIVFD
jgi:uncharacterized protein